MQKKKKTARSNIKWGVTAELMIWDQIMWTLFPPVLVLCAAGSAMGGEHFTQLSGSSRSINCKYIWFSYKKLQYCKTLNHFLSFQFYT